MVQRKAAMFCTNYVTLDDQRSKAVQLELKLHEAEESDQRTLRRDDFNKEP